MKHSLTTIGLGAGRGSALSSLCLQYLLLLRVVILAGQIAAWVAANYLLAVPPPAVPVLVVICGLGLITLVSGHHLRARPEVSESTILGQLLIDVAGLAALLFFTGGSTNPFAPLLLLPVIVAAALLHTRHTWCVAAVAVCCYTGLMFVHVHPLYIEVHPPEPGDGGHDFAIHLWGMWFGFLLSTTVVAYFVARMGATLRQHDRALARARVQALEATQLAALGTLAAGTAHELGTPLATIAILAKELQREHPGDPVLSRRLARLREQVDRCKDILAGMAARAGEVQADAGRRLSVDRYLEEILVQWRHLHPEVAAHIHCDGPRPGPAMIADRTLSQAVLNILNNAADAAHGSVAVACNWGQESLEIEVHDDGPGLPATIREHIGQPFVTTKAAGKGMGLGLYLARTTLERLGGRIEISEPGAGVRVKISLALAPLLASEAVS